MSDKLCTVAELDEVAAMVLRHLGTPADRAALTAASLARANLLGLDSHGVLRLLQYAQWIESGQIVPSARSEVVRRHGATAVVDGHWGLGQPAASMATETAVALATEFGVGAVTVANCNHIGRLGEYVQQMADADCVGMALCNSGPIVAPAGGTRPTFGTNPIAWAAPRAGAAPLVLDFSTAAIAEGKVKAAVSRGEQLPAGLVIDSAGSPTTRPEDLYADGALLAFGGHKGSGLALMIEVIGGLLSGMGAAPMPDYAGGNGTLMLAMSIEAFTDPTAFAGAAEAFGERVRQGRDGAVETAVLLPGQLETDTAALRAATGIPVPELLRRQIASLVGPTGPDFSQFVADG